MKTLIVYISCILFPVYIIAQTQESNIISRNNDFAFRIFKNICKNDNNNIFISPLGIFTTMSMTYEGAKAETAKEILNTFNFDKCRKKNHKETTNFLTLLALNNKESIDIANIAFTQEKYSFKNSYIKLLKDYKAVSKNVDFENEQNREIARNDINTWIANNTNNKILNLLAKDDINELTKLVLINAICFKADWETPFPSNNTQNMIFKNNKSEYISLFMNIQKKFNAYIDDELNFIEIPYKDNSAAMYIILPSEKNNLDQVIASITNEKLKDYIEKSSEKNINLYIPKFKFEAKYKLKETLKDMGVVTVFSSMANLSRMNGRKNLFVDNIIHQTFIEVDEKGTEASAATAAVVKEKSFRIPIEIKANRPFIYIIKEKKLGSILFIGKFNNP